MKGKGQQQKQKLPQKPEESSSKSNITVVPYVFSTNPKLLEEDILDLDKLMKLQTPSYDIEYGLSLSIEPNYKFIQVKEQKEEQLNILLTLKSANQMQYDGDCSVENYLKQRPFLDLVFIIDNSGSMNRDGLNSIKNSLSKVVEMLDENDRICIIIFNSVPSLLCNFRKLNKENKELILEQISLLQVDGLTNIHGAVDMSFNLLANRKSINQLTSVFLFSDGEETKSDEKIKESLNQKEILKNETFTIHTFGFGEEHNPSQLKNIANLKGGNYYYIDDLSNILSYFLDVIGSLFMVVAKNLKLEIELNNQNEDFNVVLKNSKLISNDQQFKVIKKNESYAIYIDQLSKGYQKQYSFNIEIPRVNYSTLQPFKKQIEIINTKLSANFINHGKQETILKEKKLSIEVYTLNQIIFYNKESSEFEYCFIKNGICDLIEYAASENIKIQQKHIYLQQRTKVLQSRMKFLEGNQSERQYLEENMNQIAKIIQSYQTDQNANFKLINIQNAIRKQYSQVMLKGDLHQSCVQSYLINQGKQQ